MKALFNAILIILVALAVILFGSINDEPVRVDFFVRSFEWPLGWAMLLFFGLGMIVSGVMVWIHLRLALNRRLRQSRKQQARTENQSNADAGQLTVSREA